MEENKKQIRIGKVTFGVVLILVGIMIFIQTLTSLDILRFVFMLWPLVLIILGIEILMYKDKENVKYDIWGGIFTVIIVGTVSIFSMFNYGINKILYDEDIKSAIMEYTEHTEATYSFNDKVTFNNILDNDKIKFKINEIPTSNETSVNIKVNNKENKKLKFKDISVRDFININTKESQITLLDSFKDFESIEITIVTSNKENIVIK